MGDKVVLYPSDDPKSNEEAVHTLRQLRNIEVRTADDSEKPRSRFLSPFIQSGDGIRHYGLHGIRAFVRRRLQEISF